MKLSLPRPPRDLMASRLAHSGRWGIPERATRQAGAIQELRSGDDLPAVRAGPERAESHGPAPRREADAAAHSGPAPGPDSPGAGGRGLRILLAEDDVMVARSTSAVLRRLGHTVTHAIDGSAAWKCFEAAPTGYDVLLLDVVMPRMGGSDLAHRARTAGFKGQIILISGLVLKFDPEVLALLGIHTFMTKPFLPSDLDRALRGL